jgi:CubicO group peptidase (beta-lactamase class C family)
MTARSHALMSVLLMAAVALIASAGAQPQLAATYGQAFDAWVAKRRPTTAIAAVRWHGETVFLKGHGVDPRAPTLIGSMSKPITAVCVGTLIRDGRLAFATPLREALAGFFRRHGPPADRRLEGVTIEQLLTHRSGLAGNDEGDPMQDIWRRGAVQGLAHLAAPAPLIAEHFRHPLAYAPDSKTSYTNTGFVVLTAVIEEVSGRPYEDYCRAAVFDRLGISNARLHPDWRQFSGARGWFLPATDYLAFLDVFDPSKPFLADVVKDWIAAVEKKQAPKDDELFEGLGLWMSIHPGGWRVLHSGILNFHGKDPDGRPTAAVIHSHASREPTGVGTFLAMTPADEDNPALSELDEAIHLIHDRVQKPR